MLSIETAGNAFTPLILPASNLVVMIPTKLSIKDWTSAQEEGSVLSLVRGSGDIDRSLFARLFVIASFIKSLAEVNPTIVCGTSPSTPVIKRVPLELKYAFVAFKVFLLVKSLTSVETASTIYPISLLHLSGLGFTNDGYAVVIAS